MNIDLNDPFVQGVIASLVAAVIFALFVLFLKKLAKSGLGLLDFFRRGVKEKTGLDTYRKTLEEKTLRISHPWMKEDQFLTDILVPIYFEVNKMSRREELETFLAREYKQNPRLRLVITGKPGSGKTIAMRVIARATRTFDTDIQPVPVLMTFSDIKGITRPDQLEHIIIEKLKFYQFEKGDKNNNTAERFVKENLYTGKLFLLFDGFDELDKANRETASKLLNTFLGTYEKIPAAISSRTAVYESEPAFAGLGPCNISMAPFSPFAVLKFLSFWKFEGNKSARALFEMINGKAHLTEMASNPLMLTIITFLYSLPKYTLPDNRVEFYEQCTRALLEEWDRTKLLSRANRYESHQKIAVLNRIAFQHVSTRGSDDELIHEDVIHMLTRKEMARLSLKTGEYPQMEKEIVQNSGLLQKIPPIDFRFPHRTFMEFFAASYLDKNKSARDILDLYETDPKKWKEVLLLYLGLNKNPEYADVILKQLVRNFETGMKTGSRPDIILFSALVQCAVPDPQTAEDILNLAREFLITRKTPVKEVVEELGFIAANPRWTYAQKAKDILLELLKQKLPDQVFQQVIFSLLHAGDKTLEPMIFDNLKRINLVEFLSKLGTKDKYFIQRLFSLDLPLPEKEKIIEGLKEAGNLDLLGYLLIENTEEPLRERAAYALFRMSGLEGFYDSLDNTEIGFLDENTKKHTEAKFKEWGWRWNLPGTENGKMLAHLICAYTAGWMAKNPGKIDKKSLEQVDNRFRYLTTGFLAEKGMPFNKFNLIGFEYNKTASTYGLKKYWRKNIDFNRLWYKVCDAVNGDFWIAIILILYLLIDLIGVIGFVQYQLGFTSTGFYRFFFDPLTVQLVFYQFVISYVLLFFLFILLKFLKKDKWLASLVGPVGFIVLGIEKIPVIRVRRMFLILSYLLAAGCLLIPFHNVIFNIFFFLYFFIWGQSEFELIHIDFALFSIDRVKEIQEFLNEGGKKV
ncbi:MAG: NACHT domain-containing protein [Candidatus Aminicenantes bacterium]|nr:MAG: NACHT domain-containing protein [Candidatus Aminicenantes bacterium]